MSLTAYSTPTRSLTLPSQENLETLAGAWLASYASPRTRETYRANLHSFMAFLEENNAGSLAEATTAAYPIYDSEKKRPRS